MTARRQTLRNLPFVLFVVLVPLSTHVKAEVDLVTVLSPQDNAWVGQKASFFVSLRGTGPFVGAAGFSLPQVPRTVMLSVGNPVVSTEKIEGESWFVQTHEFALFSQVDGVVEVPSFEVRFSDRDGYTGPVRDHVERVPAIRFHVQRPPGSDQSRFLVSTDSLAVGEKWEPQPGKARQGDIFHRTITQRANDVTGMALAPPPVAAPAGVRVHVAEPLVTDNTERGEFIGRRIDKITYVMQQAGTFRLPAVEYAWWNPSSEQYGSVTLPAVTFEVAALTAPPETLEHPADAYASVLGLVAVLAVCGLAYWRRAEILDWVDATWRTFNPPERTAARRLLRACRHNNAPAAAAAWDEWRRSQPAGAQLTASLRTAATHLQRQLYGPSQQESWNGSELAAALREMRSLNRSDQTTKSKLPRLNPTT